MRQLPDDPIVACALRTGYPPWMLDRRGRPCHGFAEEKAEVEESFLRTGEDPSLRSGGQIVGALHEAPVEPGTRSAVSGRS